MQARLSPDEFQCRWVVPCIWVPITLALLARALSTWSDQPAAACSLILAGLILWQLIEYCLHRFIFHAEPTEYWGITFHFLFHGCHHKYPTDAMRLVFPPLPAGAIAGGIWGSLRIALSQVSLCPALSSQSSSATGRSRVRPMSSPIE